MANNNADIQLLATIDINSSEPDIIRAVQILQKRIRNNDKAKIKLEADIDRTTFNTAINKLQKIIKSKDLTIDTRKSIEALLNESNAMIDVVQSARKAANEKIEFANANKKVKQSADDTADAIRRERNAMESLDDIDYIMQNITRSGQQGNSVFQQFGTTLRDAFYAFTAANILQDAIYKVIDAGREGVEVVKELNDAATSLRMATGDSYNSVKSLLGSYNELGQELGAITTDVSESADEWLRQGHSIEDTNTLIKDSMILSKVSNLESAESTKYLTSAMQGYKVAVENVLGIVDKLSAVDLESATDAGGLAEAMSRTAEGANLAGISMDRLLGMIATVGEVTQKSMSSIGESYKTIFSRMRDIKDNKLSVVGEDGEIEDLSNVEIVLDSLGIKLRESNQEFRNFQEVLDEVAGNWDNYSSVQQAAIAKAFSGVRQQENFLVMMENWDKVLEYTDVASNSSGTAEEKFGFYLESLESKTNSLKASLENLASTTISDELYGSVLDTSKAVVDLTANTGALKGLLAGLGTAGSIYVFQQLAHYLGDATQGFANLNEAMNMTRNGAVGINDMQRLVDLTSGLSQSQTRLLLSTYNLTDAQKVAILMGQGMEQELAEQQIQTWGVATAQNGATSATVTFTGALKGLWTTLKANPLILVTTLISAGIMAFQTYNQRLEETRQEMIETGKEVAKLTEDLDGLIEQYRKLGEDGAFDNSDREQAYNIQQQINELLGDEVEYINLQNGEYKEQLELLKKLQHQKANDNYAKLKDAKDASEESLYDSAVKGFNGKRITAGLNESKKERDAINKLLKDTGMEDYLYYDSFMIDIFSMDGSDSIDTDSIIQSYNDMIKLRNILSKSYEKEIGQGGVLEDFYNNLVKKIDSMSDAVQKYKDAMSDYNINEAIVQFNETAFDGIKGAFIDSEDAMKKWMNKMVSSKKVTDGVQAELIELAKTWYPQYIEQINNAINAEATKIIQDSLTDKSLSGNIESLKVQANALGLTEGAMMSLVLAEINFNKNNLNVSQKVSALKELATWAGVAQAKMNSIFTANSKSTMKDKTAWANANNVTINKYADKDGTHTYTYNGNTYSGVNAVNEALLNEAIQSQIDKMNNIKVPSGSGGSGGTSKDTKETFDWIETKISRLQRTITNFGKTVSATWKSWTDRNSALAQQISEVNKEITLQQQAYQKYMALANGVGLSSYYQNLVKNGTIDISTITNEDLIDQIKAFENFYNKALDCQDAIVDLEDELVNLAETEFDNVVQQYDDELSLIEHRMNILDKSIDQLEVNGYLVSKKVYEALLGEEENKLLELQQKYISLQSELNSSGIARFTQKWFELNKEISSTKEAILESRLAIDEFEKTIMELDWEVFDKLQDMISSVTTESNFLIDLMSSGKLVDDKGAFTDIGKATIGLHVTNYETYRSQIEDYTKAIEELDKQFANDSLDQNYLARRRELIELVQDSVLSLEDEKQSIKSLWSDGYGKLLDYMQELIDKRLKLQNSASSLFDYQKNVKDQVEEISRLQNILNSYGNDNSEEAKMLIQKYQVELEDARETLSETEREQQLREEEKLLTSLMDSAAEWQNQRLDDITGLMQSAIDSTNSNGATISDTLKEVTGDVGYVLSEQMQSIWDGTGKNIVGDGITTVSTTLTDIKNLVAKMASDSNAVANSNVQNAQTSVTPSTTVTPTVSNTPTTSNSSSNDNVITVGSRINAGNALIYRQANGTKGYHQFYDENPYYVIIGQKGNFWKVRHQSLSSGTTGWFKKSDVKAYKTGGLVDYTGLAWVDGQKGKPEAFLNANDTELFAKLKDSLEIVSKTNMFDAIQNYAKMPNFTPNNVNKTTNYGDITVQFELPNVYNYEQFMSKMQRDPQFEGMVLEITDGSSNLGKYKYSWKERY